MRTREASEERPRLWRGTLRDGFGFNGGVDGVRENGRGSPVSG